MDLSRALCSRGYPIRQHLEEEGWTRRKLTVVDLDDELHAAHRGDGIEGLKGALAARGQFSFPSLDIDAPPPRRSQIVLAAGVGSNTACQAAVVVPTRHQVLGGIANDLAAAIARRWGCQLPIRADDEAHASEADSRPLIMLGGAHQNRLALDLAMRYQTFFLDAAAPGDDGWAVTTHVGLTDDTPGVVQLVAGPGRAEEAVTCLLEAIDVEDGSLGVRPVHEISPGAYPREHLPSWTDFATGLTRRVTDFLDGPIEEAPEDPEALSVLLAAGLDGGGPEVNRYNAPTIDASISAARYYQLSGDRRALQLFRALLFRLADYYLKTPGGASYPADFDFRLGQVILYYGRLEHDPAFSDEDRLVLVNLLLACARSAYEYAVRQWTPKPGAKTRHNHETFPARTLMYAADYFEQYGMADVSSWREYTRLVFSDELWTRSKQQENAYGYETLVYEHAAAYSAFTGHGLELFADGVLETVVRRQVVATDNFLLATDYGDSHVQTRTHGGEHVAAILTTASDEATVRWFAAEGGVRAPRSLPGALYSFPGIHLPASGAEPAAGGWELAPVEGEFLSEYAPHAVPERAFDKLAFRTGWGEADQYVLLEGVGGQHVSHGHNEVNGIVRLNHRGRMWVVSNGYGRRAGLTNVNESFNTRIRGPEDHNMLVLTREGDPVCQVPAAAELLDRGQQAELAWATSALWDYGGTHWTRSLVVLADVFLLVIDRVRANDDGLQAAHIEWNCLGRAAPIEGGYRLDQQGASLILLSTAAAPGRLEAADRSASWQQVLTSGAYPHAEFPLSKVVVDLPLAGRGESTWMATLLAAQGAEDVPFELRRTADQRLRVDGAFGGAARVRTGQLDLDLEDGVLQVGLNPQRWPPRASRLSASRPGH